MAPTSGCCSVVRELPYLGLMKIFTVLGLLDLFRAALVPPEKDLTIAELKKMGTRHVRQRVRRKKHGLPPG